MPLYDAVVDKTCSFTKTSDFKRHIRSVEETSDLETDLNLVMVNHEGRVNTFGEYKKVDGENAADAMLVLKSIWIREGYITRLRDYLTRISSGDRSSLDAHGGFSFFELLVEVRAASVEVCFLLFYCTWVYSYLPGGGAHC